MHGQQNIKICRSGTSGQCSAPLHILAVHISLHQIGHWFAKREGGAACHYKKNTCKVIIKNYNLLKLLLQKGTLKVYVEVFRDTFSFPLCVTLCLATNGAVFSISSVLSVYRRYSVNSYCR